MSTPKELIPFINGLILFCLLMFYAASGMGALSWICVVFATILGLELVVEISERLVRARRAKKEPRDG